MPLYFLTYESEAKSTGAKIISNVLTRTHPVLWQAQAPPLFAQYHYSRLLFWSEIPEELAEHPDVKRYFGEPE